MARKSNTPKKQKIKHSDYYGLIRLGANPIFPEGAYVIKRCINGTWLLELCQVRAGEMVHIGVVDLQEVLNAAGKSYIGCLKKEEFYGALEAFFHVDLTDHLYATEDVETVLQRVASYTKQRSVSKYAWKQLYSQGY